MPNNLFALIKRSIHTIAQSSNPYKTMIFRLFHSCLFVMMTGLLMACSSADIIPVNDASVTPYVHSIAKGDVLSIDVFAEDNMTGSYTVNEKGRITFPLLGDIQAAGMSAGELQQSLTTLLADGYLVSPSIRIELESLAPIYILGEVNKPGSYGYADRIDVLKAVALAGGFTHRAYKKRFDIIRIGENGNDALRGHPQSLLHPGDTLVVKERFF